MMESNKLEGLTERRGRFKIAREVFDFGAKEMFQLMSQVLVYRAEMLFAEMAVEYDACSPLFELVDRFEESPWYTFFLDGDTVKVMKENPEVRSTDLVYFDRGRGWRERMFPDLSANGRTHRDKILDELGRSQLTRTV